MNRWLVRLTLLVLGVAVVALLLETRRLAELAGAFERDAWLLRQAAPAPAPAAADGGADRAEQEQGAAAASPDAAVALGQYAQVRLELHETQQQLAAVTALLEQRNAELARRAEAASERAARELAAMPEGVRQCLQGLHDCLRAEGFDQQRFLRASALDEDGLHDVELLDVADDGLGVAFVRAGRMTAVVDRSLGRLELRFFDGERKSGGTDQRLPADGWPLVFRDVDCRGIEARLPMLVRAEGSYPVAAAAAAAASDVDPGTRRQWLARLERVLAGAGTAETWRVTRFRGLADSRFLDVDLVASDARGLLVASAHCAALAMEVDRQRGVVSLLLTDGVLRQGDVESTITGEGYRMLLPSLTPERATDAMLGMVVGR